MRLPALAAASLLAGCSSAVLAPKPSDGYAALRVTETFEMGGGVVGGRFELPVTTLLINDRNMPSGEPLYCGDVVFVATLFGGMRQKQWVCFARRGNGLTIHADQGGGELLTNLVPAGAIEEIRIR